MGHATKELSVSGLAFASYRECDSKGMYVCNVCIPCAAVTLG